MLVRAFDDSNGDGTGDFRGLIEKLDYLQWLGVDCLWLPPFFTSPLRDGGYDVADYTAVLPEFGTLADFNEFVDAGARARHPGDHRLRHEPHQRPAPVVPGQPRATPTARTATSTSGPTPTSSYDDARIIFVDTEPSNWTFDPVRQQYFWHRFFSHQPDLNFDNPEGPGRDPRRAAVLARPRASTASGSTPCPTSSSEEGTNCENLPETHEFLEQVREMVDDELPRPGAARRGQPVARRTSSSTSAPSEATSATWPSTSR